MTDSGMISTLRGVVGIDIGGTNLRFGLVTENGTIHSRVRMKTCTTRKGFLRQLVKGIDELRENALSARCRLVSVGIGMPGLINRDGEILSSVNLDQCKGLKLAEELSSLTGLAVTVGNDANAAACGEHRFGVGKTFSSFLMITIGTGVGGGLILGGRLWTGIDGFAGEFGHITVEPDGRPCSCGNHGCLERYASASALVADAQSMAGRKTADWTAETLAEVAAAGDRQVADLYARVGRYLGIASATVINLLNLEAIVIGGGVAASFPLWEEVMRQEINARAFAPSARRVVLARGKLGDDAGVLGAAALAFAEFGGRT